MEGASEAERVRLLREVLTATGAGIYLATHLAGPVPAEVAAAVREAEDLELRLGRVGPDRAEDVAQREREARAVLAAVLRASPERVLLTHGAAEAMRLIALEALGRASRPPGRGQARGTPRKGWARGGRGTGALALEGLGSTLLEALRGVCAACDASLVVVPDEPATLTDEVALVVSPHVAADGRLMDVDRLSRVARSAGARLLVDVGLSVGASPLDVATFGADAVLGATHRWLLGPEAVAFAWLGPGFDERTPQRLRAVVGPFPRGTLLALARSVGWLLMYAELPWVLERTGRLAERTYAALAAVPGVRMASARGAHAALLAWSIEGWSAEQAADELSHSVFAILDADAEADLVRAGVGAWNREDELDRLAGRVAELAAHTPSTLPRRPSLTILGGGPQDAR